MITVRDAAAADRATLRALFAATGAYYGVASSADAIVESAIDLLLAPGYPKALLAENDVGAGVGYLTYAMVLPPLEGVLFVKELFVVDGARGGGVGPILLRAAAEIATARGCARLDLTTDRSNDGAMRFYPRLGAALREDKAVFRFEGAALGRLLGS